MIDHLSLGTNRYAQAVTFYQQVLAPLGIKLLRDTGSEAAFGTGAQWSFFLYPIEIGRDVVASGTHVALSIPNRELVKTTHDCALELKAKNIFSPRLRPDISTTYFGAMFHDLDGHRIELVTNSLV